MTQDAPAFFTLDRGTVSTTASLVAPVAGRYRLLASASAPAALDPGSILEDLAWRVARTDASVAGSMEGWRDWSRLEVRTGRAPRGVLVAASRETGELLGRAFAAAGWIVGARFFGTSVPYLELGEACLAPDVDAVIVGGRDGVTESERDAAFDLWARASSLARFRDDLAVIACGPFAARPEGIPDGRLFSLPAPEAVPATAETLLRQAALQVGRHLADSGLPAGIDSRVALRSAIVSLAAVLGKPVDGVEVGVAGGSRTQAGQAGELGHGIFAAAGIFPPSLLADEEAGEAVLRWSTQGGGDPAARLDALRGLALQPWSGLEGDGVRLRLAALRAALERLESTWAGGRGDVVAEATAGVTILAGGVFAGLPPAASALAVVDGLRRPGAMSIMSDHAGLLAPLGALPVEEDRRRLLADLVGDALLPLAGALVTGDTGDRKGRATASLSVSSQLGDQRLRLDPGLLQLVDVPSGIVAQLGLDPGEGAVLGVAGRTLTMQLSGGLGGLLVDTRPIPLDLPASGEARRSRLESWEASVWMGEGR